MLNLSDIHSFIGSYFIHQHIYLYVKHVFNIWYSCVKCTNLWMKFFCTIFIILLHVKFLVSKNIFVKIVFELNSYDFFLQIKVFSFHSWMTQIYLYNHYVKSFLKYKLWNERHCLKLDVKWKAINQSSIWLWKAMAHVKFLHLTNSYMNKVYTNNFFSKWKKIAI
jgi:hypothetical protein